MEHAALDSKSKSAYAKKVVFVVGAPRSGTTWLQSLLSEHPGIVTTGESHLFSGYIGPWDKRFKFEKYRENPDLGLAILFDESEMIEFYRSFAFAVMDRIASKNQSAAVILDKTPNHALFADLILKIFPDAFFIHIVRDPRAVVSSMTAAGGGWGANWAPKGAFLAAKEWCEYVDAANAIKSITSRYYEVKYESLKEDGASELLALFKFIDLSARRMDCEEYFQRCLFDKQKGSNRTSADGFYRSGEVDSWRADLSRSEVRSVEYITQIGMRMYEYKFEKVKPRGVPLRILLRALLSKVETATKYIEERL